MESSIVTRVLLGGQCFQVSVATQDNLFPFPWKKHTIETRPTKHVAFSGLSRFARISHLQGTYFAVHKLVTNLSSNLRAEESPIFHQVFPCISIGNSPDFWTINQVCPPKGRGWQIRSTGAAACASRTFLRAAQKWGRCHNLRERTWNLVGD